MIEQLIAEATECDFKVALEIKKPKKLVKKCQCLFQWNRRHSVFRSLR